MDTAFVAQGDRAFIEEEYDVALAAYTEALKLEPGNARILDARANTLIKLGMFMEASEDASKAINLEPGFSKAYLRKGVAMFNLEEYESAKEVFEAGQMQADDAAFRTWIRKCNAELEGEEAEHAAKQPRTQSPVGPAASAPAAPAVAPTNGRTTSHPIMIEEEAASLPQDAKQPTSTSTAIASEDDSSKALAPSAPPALDAKYRHQFYQLQNKVTVDVYAKALPRDRVKVDFQPTHLSVIIVDAAGLEEYQLEVELFSKVDPSACRFEVLRSKIEITMTKSDPVLWGALEASHTTGQQYTARPEVAPQPTKTAKDWNKVNRHIADLESKGELEDGDQLNNFFKKIFGNGDDDQRRAMMKSYTESNGTVLSTNWEDIGKKKTECTPPDGMVVKKWNETKK